MVPPPFTPTKRAGPPAFAKMNPAFAKSLEVLFPKAQAAAGSLSCFGGPLCNSYGLFLRERCSAGQLKQSSLGARDRVGVFGLEDFERCLSPGWGVDLFLKVFFFFFADLGRKKLQTGRN